MTEKAAGRMNVSSPEQNIDSGSFRGGGFLFSCFFFPNVTVSGGPADGTAHEAIFIPAKAAAAKCWGEGCMDSCASERLVITRITPLWLAQWRSPNWYLFLRFDLGQGNCVRCSCKSGLVPLKKEKMIRGIWG